MKTICFTIQAVTLITRTICALLLFVSYHLQASADINDPMQIERFVDGVVKPTMHSAHSSAGVVAIMKDGKLLFAKGYGYQNVESKRRVDPKTSLFRAGSISKVFVWVSVMQLVEQGKLNLDEDVNHYLKTFQIPDTFPGKPITLRHIMTHTTGVEAGEIGKLIRLKPEYIMPLARSLKKYMPKRINPPGEHASYSNWASALAGLIVANVSGMEFNQYVKQAIFDKLGMRYATFDEPVAENLRSHVVTGYQFSAGKYQAMPYELVSNFGPAGAIAISAEDLTKFAGALLNNGSFQGHQILTEKSVKAMLTEGFALDPRIRGMGLGVLLRRFGAEGLNIFGHDGRTTLFSSHMGISQSENLVVVSSFSGPGSQIVHDAFVKSFYDEFFPRKVAELTPPKDFKQRASRYAGTYANWRDNFSELESLVRLIDQTQVVAMPDNTLLIGDKRYVEEDKNLFREVDDYGRIAFQQNKQGDITGFILDGKGIAQTYKAPFYETYQVTSAALKLCMLVFLLVIIGRIYQVKQFTQMEKSEKLASVSALGLAVSNLLFAWLFLKSTSVGLMTLVYDIPLMLKISLIFPIIATIFTLMQIVCLVKIWRNGLLNNLFGRLRYSAVTFCGCYMVWFYCYWHILGFQYTS